MCQTASATDPAIKEIAPRVWSCAFQSASLGKPMRFLVIMPENPPKDQKLPVIYFFHGRGRTENSLLQSPSAKARLLASKAVVVLPRGEDGWYVNSPVKESDRYADYVDEVMALAEARFPVSDLPAHRAIGGWSMGGYGSAMTAIRKAGQFKALGTIIGLLDFPRAPIDEPGQNYEVPVGRFGTQPGVWEEFNPRLHAEGLRHTSVFLVIGETAFDRQMNEAFQQTLQTAGISVETARLPGSHAFVTVEQGIPLVFDFLEKQIEQVSTTAKPE